MKPIRNALARPGRISGSETSANVRQRLARKVCAASSMLGETPRPRADEPAPQARARTSGFQPTPQRWPPVKQPKPQTFGVKRRAPNAASDQAPASFWNALDKIRNTG